VQNIPNGYRSFFWLLWKVHFAILKNTKIDNCRFYWCR